jgi:hypothetical protein
LSEVAEFLSLTQRARRTQRFLGHRGELALAGRTQRGTEWSPDGEGESTEVAFGGGRKGRLT